MIANINPRGHSFTGVTAYLMHDKGAETSERVEWTATYNLHTPDVEKASRFMAWTDGSRESLRAQSGGTAVGRKATAGNVYHYSLSWEPGEKPDRAAIEAEALASVKRLGLEKHQFYLVAHSDTEHAHVHVVVNLVNPETGRIASNWKDRDILDRWANEYEQKHGIQCEKRAKKFEVLDQDRGVEVFARKDKGRRAELEQTVTELFQTSDSGRAFRAALQGEGLELAQGNRRGFVVVDQDGKVYALNRLIDTIDGAKGRAKTKAISARLKDVDTDSLERADEVAARITSFDRDAQEVAQQEALADAASDAAPARVQQAAKAMEAIKHEERRKAAAALSERKAKWRALQRDVEAKTAASRKKWQIDELATKLVEARDDRAALNGFWARVFKRKQIAEADERVQSLEKQLTERTGRFRSDVKGFNAVRPEWIQRRALERAGLEAPSGRARSLSARKAWAKALTPEQRNVLEAARRIEQMREEAQERERGGGGGFELGR